MGSLEKPEKAMEQSSNHRALFLPCFKDLSGCHCTWNTFSWLTLPYKMLLILQIFGISKRGPSRDRQLVATITGNIHNGQLGSVRGNRGAIDNRNCIQNMCRRAQGSMKVSLLSPVINSLIYSIQIGSIFETNMYHPPKVTGRIRFPP